MELFSYAAEGISCFVAVYSQVNANEISKLAAKAKEKQEIGRLKASLLRQNELKNPPVLTEVNYQRDGVGDCSCQVRLQEGICVCVIMLLK